MCCTRGSVFTAQEKHIYSTYPEGLYWWKANISSKVAYGWWAVYSGTPLVSRESTLKQERAPWKSCCFPSNYVKIELCGGALWHWPELFLIVLYLDSHPTHPENSIKAQLPTQHSSLLQSLCPKPHVTPKMLTQDFIWTNCVPTYEIIGIKK